MVKDGMKRTLEYCRKHDFPAQQHGRYVNVSASEDDVVYFLSFLTEKGIAFQEISIDRPTLEDYFIQEVRYGK